MLTLGYVPLTDALPLLAAAKRGLYAAHDLAVTLQPMRSWAQLREALLLGDIDAAHCLPGVPIAAQAGMYGQHGGLATALTLNHYGNAITLSCRLVEELSGKGDFDAALRRHAIAQRDTPRPLTLASVFPVSKHEFELRHWLRGLGLKPALDVNLVVIPPPQVGPALAQAQIDGFCVGEPWNARAVADGLGQVVATSRSLKLPGTEKVLAVREDWLEHPDHLRLVRCLAESCAWLDAPAHREQALPWLAAALDTPPDALRPALLEPGRLLPEAGSRPFLRFAGINRPDERDAMWLLGQMESNLAMPWIPDPAGLCRLAFRADIHDHALAPARKAAASPK